MFLVEDQVTTLQSIALTLEEAGYEVVGKARSGEAALPQIKSLRPDAVLIDVDLREGGGSMTGIQLANEIHAWGQIPCVFLTAQQDPATLRQSLQTEAVGFVGKPYSENELIFTLEKALAHVPTRPVADFIFLPVIDGPYPKVYISEIKYVIVEKGKLSLHTTDRQRYEITSNLNKFEQDHPHPSFLRIRQNTILNVDHISGWERPATLLVGLDAFHIGKTYLASVKQRLPFLQSD